MEVTFEEARAHMEIESQRQWSDLAIARATPVLFGLYSMVIRMANQLIKSETKPVPTAAWHEKQTPTFSDAIAIVRRYLWKNCHFSMSCEEDEIVKVLRALLERLTALSVLPRKWTKSSLDSLHLSLKEVSPYFIFSVQD